MSILIFLAMVVAVVSGVAYSTNPGFRTWVDRLIESAGPPTAGATGAASGPATSKKPSLYGKATQWVADPKDLFSRAVRAGFILLLIIVGLRLGIAIILGILAYIFRPVTDLVGKFWGEPWFLILLFVFVGLFGTRIGAWAWKSLFKAETSPLDGAEKFMGRIRKEYQNSFVVGILIAVGAFYFLDPQVQSSVLGDWVPERFWAFGNLGVLTQVTLLSLALFIWARKLQGTILKYVLVVATGLGFFVSLERLAHLGFGWCPAPLHAVYVWVEKTSDITQYEGGVDDEAYLAAARAKKWHNIIGPAESAQSPVTYWVFELPNDRLSRGWGVKGKIEIARGSKKGKEGEWASKGWVTLVVSQDLKEVYPIGDLRLRPLADGGPDADRNFERPPSGIWAAIDKATGGSWEWAYLGFENRDPDTAAEFDLFSYN